MHKSYIKKFYYNSTDPKFFGTKFNSSISLNLTSFSVIAQSPVICVFDVGSDSGHADLEGVTEISGRMTLRVDHPNDSHVGLDTEPFDVSLFAYDPISKITYCSKILGIHITKVDPELPSKFQQIDFVAANIVQWHKTSNKKTFNIAVEVKCEGNNESDYVNKAYLQNKLNEGICYTDDVFEIKEIKEL